jgi:DNA repair exonuclease SbcCD ATPase subunit
VSEQIIQDLLAKLQALQQEFDNLRNEISKLFRDF